MRLKDAGIGFALGFCQARGIETDRIELIQHHHIDEATQRLERVELEILLPPDFPEKYRVAVERAAASCRVKKALSSPPELLVTARIATPKNAA